MLGNASDAGWQPARSDGKWPLPQFRGIRRRRQLNKPDFRSVSSKTSRLRAMLPEYMSGTVLARTRSILLGFITTIRDGGRFQPGEALVVHRQPNQGYRDISRRSSEGHGAEVTRPPHVMRVGRGRLLGGHIHRWDHSEPAQAFAVAKA
jgi:hypothetical protein